MIHIAPFYFYLLCKVQKDFYLARAKRALCPPDKLTPFSPTKAMSPPFIRDTSMSIAHAFSTSDNLLASENKYCVRAEKSFADAVKPL